MPEVTWVMDSSSLINIKSQVSHERRPKFFQAPSAIAIEGRLKAPTQVLDEMKRGANSRIKDEALEWAVAHEAFLCDVVPALDEIQAIMSRVGDVVDHDRGAGEDDADPYVLAVAVRLRADGLDARIVTDERRDKLRKISLNTAAGILGVPPVPLAGFIRAAEIS